MLMQKNGNVYKKIFVPNPRLTLLYVSVEDGVTLLITKFRCKSVLPAPTPRGGAFFYFII